MKYFVLYSNCIIINGSKKSLIVDLQNNIAYTYPSILFEILNERKSVLHLKKKYRSDKGIDSIFEDLMNKKLGFYTNYINRFPLMNLRWDSPYEITNSIIEINETNLEFIPIMISNLEKKRCFSLQIRVFELRIEKIEILLNLLKNSKIKVFELILISKIDFRNLHNWFLDIANRIIFTKIYNSDIEENIEDRIFYFKEKYSVINCGNNFKDSLNFDISHLTESIHFNSCLNRKLSIDKHGNIKNCPSLSQSFGNIKNTTIEEALNHPDYKKYWHIKKDDIEVCKDCEYRHVCTDCRAYIEDPENIYSKPLKCGYDPYTGIWEEWSTNPLKQKAIEYYGLQELIKKDV